MENIFEDVTKNRYGYYELKSRVSDDELSKLYVESYYQDEMSTYKKQYTEQELEEKNHRLQEIYYVIEKHDLLKIGGQFLDIGCGEGFALKYFMDKGYDVTGIEFSLKGCKYHNPEVADRIIKGNAFLALDSFDENYFLGTILMDHVLEHVTEPENLICKISAISKVGTCLIISVPNDFSDTQIELWKKGHIESPFWVSTSYPPEHLSYFNKDALKELLDAYGWKMKFVMGSYPIDFNLFNENTNYVHNKNRGKSCYESQLEIEELLYKTLGIEGVVDIYGKLGNAGLGRNITAYFVKNSSRKAE